MVTDGVIARRSNRMRRVAVSVALGGLALAAAACSGGTNPTTQANTLLQAGIAAVKANDCSAAVSDFNSILKNDPTNKVDDQYAYYNRGLCEQLSHSTTAAINDYRSSLALNPNYVPALYNLGTAVSPSSPQEAENLYLQVIAIQPGNASAHLNLGYVYQTLGHKASAIQQFALAVHYQPAFISNVPAALKKAVQKALPALASPTTTGGAGANKATTKSPASGISGPT